MTVIKPQKLVDLGLHTGSQDICRTFAPFLAAALKMATDEGIEIPIPDGRDLAYIQQAVSRAVRMSKAKGKLGTRRANGRLFLVKSAGG